MTAEGKYQKFRITLNERKNLRSWCRKYKLSVSQAIRMALAEFMRGR